MSILDDAETRPDLFVWYGRPTGSSIETWATERGLALPEDLLALWEATGGGDIFESETILGPDTREDWQDDVGSANREYESEGLPTGYLVFHRGICLSAVEMSTGRYVTFAPESFQIQRTYDSFSGWYEWLRSEYASRYGLATAK